MQVFFRQTIKALDHCELALDRRNKMERDAQIMVKMLPKQIENAMKMEKMQKTVAKPKASSTKKNELNKSVTFNYTANEGRFAVAKSDIKIGEKILVEEPHVVMLLEKYAKTNCQHCFKRFVEFKEFVFFYVILIFLCAAELLLRWLVQRVRILFSVPSHAVRWPWVAIINMNVEFCQLCGIRDRRLIVTWPCECYPKKEFPILFN